MPLPSGKHDVAQDDVGPVALELAARLGDRRRAPDHEPFELDQRRQRPQRQRIVLDDQRFGLALPRLAVP